jgi:hypothetical protein
MNALRALLLVAAAAAAAISPGTVAGGASIRPGDGAPVARGVGPRSVREDAHRRAGSGPEGLDLTALGAFLAALALAYRPRK